MRYFAGAWVLGLALAATAASSQGAPAADTEIATVRNQWVEAAARDDAAAVASLYTEDAVVTSAEAPAVTGREAIQAFWAESLPLASDLEVRPSDTQVSGDLAYDFGEFTQRVTPPQGEPVEQTGEYLVVLERQPEGSWRISKHMSFVRRPEPADGR